MATRVRATSFGEVPNEGRIAQFELTNASACRNSSWRSAPRSRVWKYQTDRERSTPSCPDPTRRARTTTTTAASVRWWAVTPIASRGGDFASTASRMCWPATMDPTICTAASVASTSGVGSARLRPMAWCPHCDVSHLPSPVLRPGDMLTSQPVFEFRVRRSAREVQLC